jgi:hypothetical protein
VSVKVFVQCASAVPTQSEGSENNNGGDGGGSGSGSGGDEDGEGDGEPPTIMVRVALDYTEYQRGQCKSNPWLERLGKGLLAIGILVAKLIAPLN